LGHAAHLVQESPNQVNLRTELASLIEALNTAALPYALCGGFAVIVHGYVRATKDVDILIKESDLDRLKTIVAELGYTVPGGLLRFKADTPEETKVFRVSKFEGADFLTLDVILVTPVFQQVWATRECRADGSRPLWIVSLEGLRIMKLLAGREQDLADLAMLQNIADTAPHGE
jgi:hypothetical protein